MRTERSLYLLTLLTFLAACSGGGGTNLGGDADVDHDADVIGDGGGGGGGDAGGGGDGGDDDAGGDGSVTCVEPTCAELGESDRQACGQIATEDSCGVNVLVDCSGLACPGVTFCAADGDGVTRCREPENTCIPLDEAAACSGISCGTASDGCDGQITCPSACEVGDLCIAGACVTPTCAPKTCENAGPGGSAVTCGEWGDGCQGTIDCNLPEAEGGCAADQVCDFGTGTCEAPQCESSTASDACAMTCGTVSDGCGGFIDCDAEGFGCPSGETCGGGGSPGACGAGSCEPLLAGDVCPGHCGFMPDGCGGGYDCSLPVNGGVVCSGGQWCGGGGVHNECGKPECTPATQAEACAQSGFDCGSVSDGCGGTVSCGGCDAGAGELCGYASANVCGTPTCEQTPVATACAGKCGSVNDGCDGSYTCDAGNGGVTCTGGDWCGADAPNECGGAPTCTPADCATLGYTCGFAPDGCGGVLDCWPSGQTSCPNANEACIGDPATCVAGTGGGGCTGPLCADVPSCTGQPQQTRITGRVTSPDGEINVPNAIVYIPRDPAATLPAIATGPACDRCEDEDLALGPVLAGAITDFKGEFTLEGNIPVGAAFNIVVKAGKWRRVVAVPAGETSACATADLGNAFTRLPANKSDGLAGTHMPLVAIATGDVDAMECVLFKMGVDQAEFTTRSGTGRIHMYRANGAHIDGVPRLRCDHGSRSQCRAASCQASSAACADCSSWSNTCNWDQNGQPSAADLYDGVATNGDFTDYDMVIWDCEGSPRTNYTGSGFATARSKLLAYVNSGGRFFASHWSYDWLRTNGTLQDSATWSGAGLGANGDRAYVSFGRPRGNANRIATYARWLHNEGAATVNFDGSGDPNFAYMAVVDPRDQASSVNVGSDEWMFRTTNTTESTSAPFSPSNTSVQQFSFNTPFNDAANACGRVAYTAFHVATSGSDTLSTSGKAFPTYCGGSTLTAQEKTLAYMLFDLSACISEGEPPQPPECTPLTAGEACVVGVCGTLSDGCGGIIDCGNTCPEGQFCGVGGVCVDQTCTPATCASLGANCGEFIDGCGGTTGSCGDCAANQVCGLNQPGVCGTPACTPTDCAAVGAECGLTGDGCGGILDCGDCVVAGEACGGGGVPNVCDVGTCEPATCEDFAYDCGLAGDGCGGQIDCGECTAPRTCGGNGEPNVCGAPACAPLTCELVGAECGWIGDGCGGSVNCGPCENGGVCGGAGPNLCGDPCVPKTCTEAGAECGAVANGCGGIVQCGACDDGLVCGAQQANQCGTGSCTATTCEAAGAECGSIGDGCGGTLSCGACTVPGETCGGGGVANVCGSGEGGCTPHTVQEACTANGYDCGAVSDSCGGLLNCGSCGAGEACGLFLPNQCGGLG